MLFPALAAHAQQREAQVHVQLDMRHVVGGEDTFDRKKFINIHSTHAELDWRGEDEKLDYLVNDLDVYFGRDSGMISWELAQLKEDANHRGYVDFPFMENRGGYARRQYAKQKTLHRYHDHSDVVVAAQVHPFWPDGTKIKPADGSKPWSLATPEATAQYMAYWLNMYTGGEGVPRPQYLEVMNEPLYELLQSDPNLKPGKVFDYHNKVAQFIRNLNKDVKIGGYTVAFPDFEKRDFKRWEERWKSFIDMTGDNIDFYSLHLYDFPGIDGGKQQYRKGCNLEATFDMLEHYSQLKFGKVKPLLISEYGSQLHDWFGQPWSSHRDWLCLKATNSMLMQFMRKPDVILKTVPFITAKADWGFNVDGLNQPYYWRLLRRANEPEAYSGEWMFTDQIKFYELWSKVKGTRVATKSTDENLLVDSYVDGHRAFVVFNNLTEGSIKIEVNLHGVRGTELKQTFAKHLYLHDSKPRLDTVKIDDVSKPIVLGSESTMVVEYAFAKPIACGRTFRETKHYAKTYFQKIAAAKPMTFVIDGVEKSAKGLATLRLGIGRDHGCVLKPAVKFNGSSLKVSGEFKGPSQKDRDRFFGVLEIPVPYALLQESNTVSVQFSDAGGHVSSVILQAFAIGE